MSLRYTELRCATETGREMQRKTYSRGSPVCVPGLLQSCHSSPHAAAVYNFITSVGDTDSCLMAVIKEGDFVVDVIYLNVSVKTI